MKIEDLLILIVLFVILIMAGGIILVVMSAIFVSISGIAFKKFDTLHTAFDKNFRECKNEIIPELQNIWVKIQKDSQKRGELFLHKDSMWGKHSMAANSFRTALENEEDYHQNIMTYIGVFLMIGLILACLIYFNINKPIIIIFGSVLIYTA